LSVSPWQSGWRSLAVSLKALVSHLTFRALRIALVVAVIALTGCSNRSDTDKHTPREDASRHEHVPSAEANLVNPPQSVDSLRDDVVEHGLLATDSRLEVAARFGQPDSMTSRSVINRHIPSQTDSIVDLFYPGLHLTYYVVGEGAKEFLQTAVVSDNRYLKYPQVGIGAPEAAVLNKLGEPGAREPGKYRYDCARCIGEESPAYFYFDRGKVKRIEYSFYVD
jgi:hypothetical protein